MTSTAKEKIIVALDAPNLDSALRLADELEDAISWVKIGLQLFAAEGPSIVSAMKERQLKVFLDLKFHDIPNTVCRAAEEAVKLGVEMFTLHATGGLEMMRETGPVPQTAEKLNALLILLAVTILTSLDEKNLEVAPGPGWDRGSVWRNWRQAGVDGAVASPRKFAVRRKCGPHRDRHLRSARPVEPDDQKRVLTAGEAVSAGADYIVVGRPVRLAPDPAAAMDKVIAEIA
jgi:orotidine-5'-phosphate decarboxylase